MSAIRRNLLWLFLAQTATWAASVALLIVAPRQLGGATFGELAFAMTYIAFFEMAGQFGTADYLTKTVARHPDEAGRYARNAVRIKVVLGLVLSAIAILVAVILGFSELTQRLIVVYTVSMVANILTSDLAGVLRGLQRMGRMSLYNVLRTYAGTVAGVVILYLGSDLVWYGLAFGIAALIPVIGNYYELRGALAIRPPTDRSTQIQILRGGWPFFVLSALMVVYGSVDIPMVAAFSDSETVGWYALAYRWISVPAFIATTAVAAFFPVLAATAHTDPERWLHTVQRSVHLVMLVSTPAAVGMAFIARDLIDLLYGDEYASTVPVMWVLAVHIPVVALDVMLGAAAISIDRQRRWIVYASIAAVFNPIANLAAIPLAMRWYDNAAIGAAFTTVLTEIILAVGAARICGTGILTRQLRSMLLRILLASATLIVPLLLLPDAPLAVRIALAIVTYVAASIALRTALVSDIVELAHDVLRRRRSDPASDPG